MQLSTFGAILGFAMDFELQAEAYYQKSASVAYPELFRSLAGESKKRYSRLERARREGISEMILESISGLSSEKYQINIDASVDPSVLLDQACLLEEHQERFYRAAAEKLPIKEVERTFLRLATENERRLSRLREFEG